MKRKQPEWLRDAVFYQIYPQSFYDSNGDGTGDIPGITAKLDYIQSLGCNALWINPCFVSPFRDAGYDVADYYRVAPRYGTNGDLKRLFRQAGKLGIKVCLDLVPGHTSVDHPWFQQSRRDRKNRYRNYYIWSDNWIEDTGPLKSIRGGAPRNGSYITNFFWSQPALNYGFARCDPKKKWQLPVDHPDCQAVRREMFKVMRYWLDMGAAGFRVDMAHSLIKNDKDCQKTSELWHSVREMFEREYPEAVLVSEWSHPALAVPAGFHVDFYLNWRSLEDPTLLAEGKPRDVLPDTQDKCFFTKDGGGDVSLFVEKFLHHYRRTKHLGYISIPTGNHDLHRLRLGRTLKEVELAFALVLTMPGVPFIYYGDEIGMRQLRKLPSKEGGYTRTGARTPMQWDGSANAGFSSEPVDKLYLPIDPAKNRPTVADQEAKPDSLLNHVRKLIALRQGHPALGADGEFVPLYARTRKYPFVYLRKLGAEKFIIAINPSGKTVNEKFTTAGLGEKADYRLGTLNRKDREGGLQKVSRGKGQWHLKLPGIAYAIFRI